MLRLTSEIVIEESKGTKKWQTGAINSCMIVEDIATLTDTCELLLPKNIKWEGGENFKLPIKRGDKITVKLGYDGVLKTRFVGYIRTVDAKKPVKILCEDGMFLLKTAEVTKKGYKKVMLEELITDLLAGTGIDFELIDKAPIPLGQYRISQNTVAEELNELKNKYGLRAYFRILDGVSKLYVGLGYPLNNRRKESFVYGKNLISEEFVYRVSEDLKVKVKATSRDNTDKEEVVEVGDKDGELYTVYRENIDSEGLRLFAESELNRFKTTGFKGSFETFGEPFVNKCDIAYIEASDNNKGSFLIKKLEVNFGMNGYRQKIELGQPL